jgi:uncharacterized protein
MTLQDASARAPNHQASLPLARGQCLVMIDVLRGFALLGILLTNINHFASPEAMHDMPIGAMKPALVGWHERLDMVIIVFKWIFIEGKMRSLFAALFGAGCVMLTSRIEAGSGPGRAAGIYYRRNLWLLIFGLIHGIFIWTGDILFTYSICGLLFLYPFRHLAARKLIISGLVIWFVLGTAGVVLGTNMPAVLRADRVLADARNDAQMHRVLSNEQRLAIGKAERRWINLANSANEHVDQSHAPYLEHVENNLHSIINPWLLYGILDVLGVMLIGMGLIKNGFFAGLVRTRTYALIAVIGYAIAMPLVLIGFVHFRAADYSMASFLLWFGLPYAFTAAAAMLANASLLLVIIKKGWLQPVTRALGAVGRTAFSNYIGTSLICQWLFVWGPYHLYGELEFYQQLYVVAGVWAVNMVASRIWLRYFAFGPLEWIWRSLTYWQVQPLRIRQSNVA